MEDLTEVITAAEFHPHHCNLFVYSSSKGTLRLCDMREAALCDKHSKCEHARRETLISFSSRRKGQKVDSIRCAFFGPVFARRIIERL